MIWPTVSFIGHLLVNSIVPHILLPKGTAYTGYIDSNLPFRPDSCIIPLACRQQTIR